MIPRSWDTTQDSLLGYFGRFGEVIDCVVMKHAETGRSRGFGFVTFADPGNIDEVLASCPHNLDGRTIDPKACNPRSMQKPKKSTTQHFPKVGWRISWLHIFCAENFNVTVHFVVTDVIQPFC